MRAAEDTRNDDLQGNVDNIITGTTAVGETGSVTTNDSEGQLGGQGLGGDGDVETENLTVNGGGLNRGLIDPGDTREEGDEHIITRGGRGQGGQGGSENGVDRSEEEAGDDRGKGRVEHIGAEVVADILRGHASVEDVLVTKTDNDLVDQGVTQSGDLGSGEVIAIGIVLELTDTGPGTDHLIGGGQAVGRNLQGKSSDVLVGEGVVVGRLGDGAGESRDWDEVDQIENTSQVHREAVSTLAEENLTNRRAGTTEGNVDVVDVLIRVGLVIGESFFTSVVEGLVELGRSVGGVGNVEVVAACARALLTRLNRW